MLQLNSTQQDRMKDVIAKLATETKLLNELVQKQDTFMAIVTLNNIQNLSRLAATQLQIESNEDE